MENNFLQSNEWRKFQEAVGHKTLDVSDENFSASIVEHELPIVGKYFYIPRGPVFCHPELVSGSDSEMLKPASPAGGQVRHDMEKLITLAKKEKAGWIRIEPENKEILKIIENIVGVRFIEPKGGFNKLNPYEKQKKYRIIKSPHDMQPRETLIMDISKSEEEILAGMKSKTRYNIKLAEKKGVSVISEQGTGDKKYIKEFLRLNRIMSERQGIVTHEEDYYRKMFEILPESMIKLYVAEYESSIIAANIVILYGDTAYYLHGASDDKYKNVMAPHLLQWRQIQDAREVGCVKYDFCGVKVNDKKGRSWEGITRFKLGFSQRTKPVEFPGSYDIIVSPVRYWAYRVIQKTKSFIR